MLTKAGAEILEQLSLIDREVLKAVYRLRTLDEALMQRFFYAAEDDGVNEFTRKRIQWFVRQEILGIEEYGEDQCAFYLTQRGIQVARELFDRTLYTVNKDGKKVYEVTAGALRPAKKLLNHQLHLNALALDIIQQCGLAPDCYKDSKFADAFTYAQPDGVFELPDMDIFLEMDMAHERVTDLLRKWEHYRMYFSSRDYYLKRNKKIVVLFATENIKSGLALRRGKVLESMARGAFDLFGENFDGYIGTSVELAALTQRLLSKNDSFSEAGYFLQSQLRFSFSRPASVKEKCGEEYLYMRQLNEQRQVLVRDGRPQRFFVENYMERPVAVLHRIAAFPQTTALLSSAASAAVPLLVLVPSEDAIYRDLRAVDALGVPNVYYTTMERLRNQPLPKALFGFDQIGNRFHFTDYTFREKIHEKKGR